MKLSDYKFPQGEFAKVSSLNIPNTAGRFSWDINKLSLLWATQSSPLFSGYSQTRVALVLGLLWFAIVITLGRYKFYFPYLSLA